MIFWTLWLKSQKDLCPLPCGEYTLRLIGIGEMPLLEPVILSVSASISARTSSKSTNFFPLQCRNSAYSTHSDRVTFTRGDGEIGREGETEDKGNKKERESERENIKLNGWKQQIEDSVPSLRHCDWGGHMQGSYKRRLGCGCVQGWHTHLLYCWSAAKWEVCGSQYLIHVEGSPWVKETERKNKKNKHQICCKGDTKDIIQVIKMKRKRQEERKSYINSFLHSVSISPPFGLW